MFAGRLGRRSRLPVSRGEAVLVKAVAFTADLDEVRVMHQAIEEGCNRRRIAEELGPVVEWSIRGQDR